MQLGCSLAFHAQKQNPLGSILPAGRSDFYSSRPSADYLSIQKDNEQVRNRGPNLTCQPNNSMTYIEFFENVDR